MYSSSDVRSRVGNRNSPFYISQAIYVLIWYAFNLSSVYYPDCLFIIKIYLLCCLIYLFIIVQAFRFRRPKSLLFKYFENTIFWFKSSSLFFYLPDCLIFNAQTNFLVPFVICCLSTLQQFLPARSLHFYRRDFPLNGFAGKALFGFFTVQDYLCNFY